MRILVTGASSGIGRATALHLAALQHEVVAGVRQLEDAPTHPRIRPVALDVTDVAQLAASAEDVGELDGLVNNAGITLAGPLEYLPLNRLREQLEVNVVGLVATTQAFLPAIRASHGRIVMMSSTAGRIAVPLLGAYSASKFAVEAISDCLRQELRPWGISVSIIEPGSFKSKNRSSTETAVQADREHMSAEGRKRYGSIMDAFARFSAQTEAKAGPPERVAAAVERALTTGRPRARYVVGGDAHVAFSIGKLPASVMDRVLSKTVGITQKRADG